jgi:hypothetical protein
MRSVLLFTLGLSLLVPAWQAELFAQAVPTVEVNKAFKVAATHDGAGTTHYVLTVDRPGTAADVVVTLPAVSLAAGEVSFDVPAQAAVGAYSATVCARNVDPNDASNFGANCTAALAFNVAKPVMAPPPLKPGIRIVGTLTIGGVQIPVMFDVARVEDRSRTLRVGEIQ